MSKRKARPLGMKLEFGASFLQFKSKVVLPNCFIRIYVRNYLKTRHFFSAGSEPCLKRIIICNTFASYKKAFFYCSALLKLWCIMKDTNHFFWCDFLTCNKSSSWTRKKELIIFESREEKEVLLQVKSYWDRWAKKGHKPCPIFYVSVVSIVK